MTGLMQLVLTIWLSKHPVTYTLPQIYSTERCVHVAELITRRMRRPIGPKMVIECVMTDRREA